MILAVHECWGLRARLILVVAVAAGLAALPACGGDDNAPTGATVPTPTTTTTVADDDPWAVPATIDEPYVQRVLDELARIEGEALREIVSERAFTERSLVLLAEIFTADELPSQLDLIEDALENNLEGVREDPGDPEYELDAIRSSSQDCIFATVRTDLGAVLEEPRTDSPLEFVTLRRASAAGLETNVTGWQIDELFFVGDGSEDEVDDGCDFE